MLLLKIMNRPVCILVSAFLLWLYPAVSYCEGSSIPADIFGPRGGRFHPFVLIQETYTDNLYKTNTDTRDDFITTLSPGIWIAIPETRVKPAVVESNPEAPGGLQLSRIEPDSIRKFQAYALYSVKFITYSSHSDKNHVNQNAQALMRYNFSSGISVDLLDIFSDQEEEAGNGMSGTFYRYRDNLLNVICKYHTPSQNLKLKLDFKNYYLDYTDKAAEYRDRSDNSASFSVSYRVLPKTFLLIGYGLADIDFDTGSTNDSTENQFYSGISWNMSEKAKGIMKLGYIEKNFDQSDISNQEDFLVELQSLYTFSSGPQIKANGYRRFNEADIPNASSRLSNGVALSFSNQFTPKWFAELDALYEKSDYNEIDRDDNLFSLNPAIRFTAKKWLMIDLEYTYEKNDSNIQMYDYQLHQFYLGASLSM